MNMSTKNLKERTGELVTAFCGGDDSAFSELYDLYVHILFNYGSRLTSNQELLKDCIHDVFVKVYTKRDNRQAIKNFGSYILISLKNRLLDEFRRQTFTAETAVESYVHRQAVDDIEREYIADEHQLLQESQVAHLMTSLTRRQRQAITLYYLEQRKYEEICDIMQMNYHSVRNLMHRSMLRLREAANL